MKLRNQTNGASLVFLALLCLFLAGCNAPTAQQAPSPAHAFQTTYGDDRAMTLTLASEPATIMAPSGKPVPALHLRLEPNHGGFIIDEYLDSDWLLIRQDFDCRGTLSCDNSIEHDWTKAGLLSDSGYAWNIVLDKTPNEISSEIAKQVESWSIHKDGASITKIGVPNWGNVSFQPGDPIPIAVEPWGEQQSFVEGKPLDTSGIQPHIWPNPVLGSDRPFPGYAADAFQVGVTPKQHHDALLAERGNDAAIQRGCLVDIVLGVPDEPGFAEPQSIASRWTYWDNGYTTYRVSSTNSPIFGSQHTIEEVPSSHLQRETSCKEQSSMPWPKSTYSQWYEQIAAVGLTGDFDAVRIAIGTSHVAVPNEGPFSGWTIQATFTPPYAQQELSQTGSTAYNPYTVFIDPVTSAIVRVIAAPGTID